MAAAGAAPITVRVSRLTEGRLEALEFGREVAGVTREQVLPGGYASATVDLVPRSVPASAWLPGSDVVIATGAHTYFRGRAGDPGQQGGYLTELPVTGVGFAAATDHTYAAPPDSTTLYTSLAALRLIAADVAPDLTIATSSAADDPQGTHRLLDFDGKTLLEVLDMLVEEGALGGELLDWLAFDETIYLRRRVPPARDAAHYWVARDDAGLERRPSSAQLLTSLRVGYTVGGAQRYTAWGDVVGATDSGRRPRSRTIRAGELTDGAALQMRDTLLGRAATPVVPSSIRGTGLFTPAGMWTPPQSVRVGQTVYVVGDAVPSTIVSVKDRLPPNGLEVELDALPGGFGTLMKRIVSSGRDQRGLQYAAGLHPDNTAQENDTALKLEIAKCEARGGGEIRIPPGEYAVLVYASGDPGIPVLSDYITLVGASADATRLVADAASANALGSNVNSRILLYKGAGVRFTHFTLDGNAPNITQGGNCAMTMIRRQAGMTASDLRLDNMILRGAYAHGNIEGYPIDAFDTVGMTFTQLVIQDCLASGLSLSADDYGDDLGTIVIDGFSILNCGWNGLTIYGVGGDITITGGRILRSGNGSTRGGNGLNIESTPATLQVSNVTFQDSFRAGVQFLGASGPAQFTNCTLRNSGDSAIWGSSAGEGAELRIADAAWTAGIGVPQPGTHGIAQGVVMSNCRFLPPAAQPHLRVSTDETHDLGLSIPGLTLTACQDADGHGPEYWRYEYSAVTAGPVVTTYTRTIGAALRMPTLPGVREYALLPAPLATGETWPWQQTDMTVGTSITAPTGFSAPYAYVLTSTAAHGRTARPFDVLAITPEYGRWALVGEVLLDTGDTADAEWLFGFASNLTTSMSGRPVRFQPREEDRGTVLPFVAFSVALDGTTGLNRVRIQCETAGTNTLTVGGLRLILLDGFGTTPVGALSVGGGTEVLRITKGAAALNFPSITAAGTAGASAELTLTATGAAAGDLVTVMPTTGIEAGLTWTGYVSAADTITVRLSNMTNAAIDPANRTWHWELREYS